MVNNLNLLELFKGTGSVGKVAKKYNFNVVSLDLENKYKPDILTNILKWNYKDYFKNKKIIPDFIWASPPCNTYSKLAYPLKERNTQTAEPYSERAKLGTKILYKTLEIINYAKKLNPNLKFVIENPSAMMRHDKKIKKLKRFTTLYCLYGDKREKRIDFFANFNLNLKLNKSCNKKTVSVVKLPLCERYKIPPKLIEQIFNDYFDSTKNKGAGIIDNIKEGLNEVPTHMNNVSSDTLIKYGSLPIKGLTIIRSPLKKHWTEALNAVSLGKFKELQKKYGFDKLFHLSLLADVDDKVIILEKNEVPHVAVIDKGAIDKDTEYLNVPLKRNNLTLNEMIENTVKLMGETKFFDYDALGVNGQPANNCQNFVQSLIQSVGLLTPKEHDFIYQDISKITNDLNKSGHSYVPTVIKAITNLGSRVSRFIGKGKNKNKKSIKSNNNLIDFTLNHGFRFL